jgi:ubiquinone/menaquinone biosynthesis C-methylase UbiE
MEVFEKKSTIEQWDEDYYHPIALKLYDRAILNMLQMMAVEPGATVLDAGCGPGVHGIRAAKAGHHVCAIDISEAMLEQARQRAEAENVADRIEFYQQDLTELDLADSSFRYVFSALSALRGKMQLTLHFTTFKKWTFTWTSS